MNRVGGLAFSVIAISACADPAIDGGAPTGASAALTHGVVCGDGTRGEGEDCDDGNVDDGDGCSSSCRLEDGVRGDLLASSVCGNHDIEDSEGCDDGNLAAGDGCDELCAIEPGFTCFVEIEFADLPDLYSVCEPTGCGDGIIQSSAGEGCDDGNTASGDGCSVACAIEPGASCVDDVVVYYTSESTEILGLQSVCTPGGSTCGDGVRDGGEACDDGARNGEPGYCSLSCDGRLPRDLFTLGPDQLELIPDVIGVLIGFTPDIPLCLDEPPSPAVFEDRLALFDDYEHFIGLVAIANEDFIVEQPLFFLNDGSNPLENGSIALEFAAADAFPMFGFVEVRAGDPIIVPVAGASMRTDTCPCSTGSVIRDRFCTTPDGPPPGFDPCTSPDAQCPDFMLEGSVLLSHSDGGFTYPAGSTSQQVHCSDTCGIQGQVIECGAEPPPVPDGGRPETLCGVGTDQLTNVCGVIGGQVGAAHCPGVCGDRELREDCGSLGPMDGLNSQLWLECALQDSISGTDLDGCFGDEIPEEVAGRPLRELDERTAWILCSNGAHPQCDEFLKGSLLGGSPMLQCSAEVAERLAQCRTCSDAVGGGCLATGVPLTRPEVQANLLDGYTDEPWAKGKVRDVEDPKYREGVASEILSRLRARMGHELADAPGSDPVSFATGELTLEATDVAFPSRGVPFELRRSYRSGAQRYGALGPGWTHNYEERIEPIGDPHNRKGMPEFCTRKLGNGDITCLLHHAGDGRSTLYALDATRGLYVPSPSGAGAIAVRLLDEDSGDLDAPVGTPYYVLTEQGGIRKQFDISGVMVSMTDEMGYGVRLHWRNRAPEDAEDDGAWSGVLPDGLFGVDKRSLAAGQAHRLLLNRLNALELAGVEDSYGRRFSFQYETYFSGLEVFPGGPQHRRRLAAVSYKGADLVRYRYRELDETNEAYLDAVARRGLGGDLLGAAPMITEYEYAHELIEEGGALAVDLSDVDDPGDTRLANDVHRALADHAFAVRDCLGAFTSDFSADALEQSCGTLMVPPSVIDGTGLSISTVWRSVHEQLADNIVRVRRDGDVELETLFEVDPRRVDFDRAVAQRFGVLPAPRATGQPVLRSDTVVHTWLTDMPESRFAQAPDGLLEDEPALRRSAWFDGGNAVPTEVLERVELVGHDAPEGEQGEQVAECNDALARELPAYRPWTAVGRRTDENLAARPTVKRTEASCSAIAARHARNVFAHELVNVEGTLGDRGLRRAMEWDLALVCRWVQITDRTGVVRTYGLNYAGAPLVIGEPSPSGSGLAITIRRVNAEALVDRVEDTDGVLTLLTYEGEDEAFSDGLNMRRGLLREVEERAPFSVPIDDGVNTTLGGIRTWTFAYEPAFQQLARATAPDGAETRRLFDWQQLRVTDPLARRLQSRVASATGAVIADTWFSGLDLDGDGETVGEVSAGVVAEAVRNVDNGGPAVVDVGVRTLRDPTGLPRAQHSLSALFEPSADFDPVRFRYYEDLEDAEAGILEEEDCSYPRGPLGETTRLRFAGATSPEDIEKSFVAYDRLGGVRLSVDNDDEETSVVFVRDRIGRVVREERPAGLVITRSFDARGQLVEETLTDTLDATTPESVTRFAWGLGGVEIGRCTEIDAGACAAFDAYALEVTTARRENRALPERLPGATLRVTAFDEEDRPIAVLDSLGHSTLWERNDAGVIVQTLQDATPPIKITTTHDDAGRVVKEAVGDSDRVETLYAYDGWSRLSAVQRLAPLGLDEVTNGTGTIERIRYDVQDRETARWVEGDDGDGARVILGVTRSQRNAIGLERFVHRYAASALPSTPPTATDGVDADDAWATEELAYDAAGRPVFYAAEGHAVPTLAAYDGLGLTTVEGRTSRAVIDRDPSARTTTVTRTGLAEGTVGSAAPRTSIQTTALDARGLTTSTSLVDAENGVPRVQTWSHDALGRLRVFRDAAHRGVRLEYDNAGRPTTREELSPSGGVERSTSYLFDEEGRLTAERPRVDAPPTTTYYDEAGRVVERSSGAVTPFQQLIERDDAGRVAKLSEGRGTLRDTTIAYAENASRAHEVRVEGALAKRFVRDGLERVVEAIDTNVVLPGDASLAMRQSRPTLRTSLVYDALGRVRRDDTAATFPPQSPTLPGGLLVPVSRLDRAFGADFVGPSHIATANDDALSFTYSGTGLLASVERTIADDSYTVDFSYEGGLWVGASVSRANTWVVEKRRDALGYVKENRIGVVGSPALAVDQVLRGPTGKVTAERRVGPLLDTSARGFRYDGLARFKAEDLQVANVPNASAFLAQIGTALADEDAGSDALTNVAHTFETTLSDADALTQTTEDAESRSFLATFDPTAGGVPPLDVNGKAITRDANDRVRGDTELTYVFDALDRLVLVTRGPKEELRVAYDGVGRRRLERRRMKGNDVEDVVLEYDGPNVIEETDLRTGAIVLATTHAQGIDAPLVSSLHPGTDEAETFVLRTNARGDVVTAALDGDAAVDEEQQLDAWGERTVSTRDGEPCVEGDEGARGARRFSLADGKCANRTRIVGRFGIGGARAHGNTKLVDLRNRVYAPHLRGFLSRDPLGNIDSESVFAYVAGDPINLRDPWGLAASGDDDGVHPCPGGGGGKCKTSEDTGREIIVEQAPTKPESGETNNSSADPTCSRACAAARASHAASRSEERAERARRGGGYASGTPSPHGAIGRDVVFASRGAGRVRGWGRQGGLRPSEIRRHMELRSRISNLENEINRYRDPSNPYRYRSPPVLTRPGSSPLSERDVQVLRGELERHMNAGPHPNSPMGRALLEVQGGLAGKAPAQVRPGLAFLEGSYVNDLGQSHRWRARYDEYGRLVERTDFTALPNPKTHTNPHHHLYRYGPGENGTELGPFRGPGPTTGD